MATRDEQEAEQVARDVREAFEGWVPREGDLVRIRSPSSRVNRQLLRVVQTHVGSKWVLTDGAGYLWWSELELVEPRR